jgi:phenylalanine-4-hydroxylase
MRLGLLSSFGELEYACATSATATDSSEPSSPNPQLLPWDPETASQTAYPITTYQPVYFVAER